MSSTSSDLIHGVREHDQAAWERLVGVYGALVYYWCRRSAGLPPEDADDVVQEVFTAVAHKIGEFQKVNGRGSFRGWLRVITTNKIVDHRRREARQHRGAGGSDAAHALDQVADPLTDHRVASGPMIPFDDVCEQSVLINRILLELQPRFDAKSWSAFWQGEILGQPRQEIAEQLQISVAAVNQAIYRIRNRLREALDELDV